MKNQKLNLVSFVMCLSVSTLLTLAVSAAEVRELSLDKQPPMAATTKNQLLIAKLTDRNNQQDSKAIQKTLNSSSLQNLLNKAMGPGSGGGGDPYTLDFVNTAYNEVIPWLEAHGSDLPKPVSADAFKQKINPKRIIVVADVYESCDGSQNGRTVVGCYNAKEKIWLLSRTLYPLDAVDSPMKRNFIMHEIFRALGIEGDEYEQTRAITRFQVLPENFQKCASYMYHNAGLTGEDAVRACERSGADEKFQKCANYMYHNAGLFTGEDAVRACERSGADENFQKCADYMHHNAGLIGEDAVRACERSGADEKFQKCANYMYHNAGLTGEDAVRACQAR